MAIDKVRTRPKARAILDDPSFQNALPRSFLYGCATAAYQVEGAIEEDGKGLNVWDETLKSQDNGELACDSYHLWKEDIKLLKQYGCNSYRFSVSWARIVPLGGRNDPVNEAGIKYYSDLIDALLAENITPFVTIFHWDVPLELQKRYGGFFDSDEMVADFVSYARILFERFGDRVKHWVTYNEPHIFAMQSSSSYLAKEWVHKRDHARLAKGSLLAHAHTVALYRKKYQPKQKGRIGLVLNCDWIEGARKDADEVAQFALDWVMGFFADPVYLGSFPPSVMEYLGTDLPTFTQEEWNLLKGSSDFFGWNHYGTQLASGKRLETDNPRLVSFGSVERVFERDGEPIGVMGEAGHPYDVPWGFRKLIRYIHDRYTGPASVPIVITECGFCVDGESRMTLAEKVDDVHRQDYFSGYLKELVEAVRDDGINIGGFMVWSLMDNLEWLYGYGKRFGITVVDMHDGCKRYPKDSSKLVKDIFDHIIAKE